MKITSLQIPDLKLIELKSFSDNRGFFVERFNANKFAELGLPTAYVQDNHSRSLPNVLRGLHYQAGQSKMVGVVRGKIWDVAVDIRPKSKTFGQSVSVVLDADAHHLFWIPDGFAHGFCVLGDEPADVIYKVTTSYDPQKEKGILWSDIILNIKWPIQNPILSARDLALPDFSAYKSKLEL